MHSTGGILHSNARLRKPKSLKNHNKWKENPKWLSCRSGRNQRETTGVLLGRFAANCVLEMNSFKKEKNALLNKPQGSGTVDNASRIRWKAAVCLLTADFTSPTFCKAAATSKGKKGDDKWRKREDITQTFAQQGLLKSIYQTLEKKCMVHATISSREIYKQLRFRRVSTVRIWICSTWKWRSLSRIPWKRSPLNRYGLRNAPSTKCRWRSHSRKSAFKISCIRLLGKAKLFHSTAILSRRTRERRIIYSIIFECLQNSVQLFMVNEPIESPIFRARHVVCARHFLFSSLGIMGKLNSSGTWEGLVTTSGIEEKFWEKRRIEELWTVSRWLYCG